MKKGSKTKNKIDWKVGWEKSSSNEPELPSLIAPATNKEIITYQGEVPAERYEIQGRYRNGAHSVIYKARDRETGNIVGIKKHLHYIPETDDAEEIRLAEDRFRREAQILAKLNHPGIMDAYGFFFKPEDGVSTPHLVMELIDQESLEESLVKGRTFNEKNVRALALSVGTILDYMHTVNGQPIIYRDLKPDNVKVMPKEAEWPHKIVDFSESRIGRSTMSGSVTGTIGYNAPEIYGGRIADQSTDFYSLMRIAAHMLIGDDKKFMASWFGNTSLREMKEEGDLNVSEQFLKAIERATARDPEKRYKTLVELAKDLGYGIDRAPQNREELERVLGHESLPARIKSKKQRASSLLDGINLPDVFDNDDGTLTVGRFTFNKGKNVYETSKNIRSFFKDGYFEASAASVIGSQRSISILAYLQHEAKEYPVLQNVLNGRLAVSDKSFIPKRATLEAILREKKPSFLEYEVPITMLDLEGGLTPEKAEKYELAKQTYDQRRAELLKIFGMNEGSYDLINHAKGVIGGGIVSLPSFMFAVSQNTDFLPYVVPWILGHIGLGAIAGSNIGRYAKKRKLLKEAREMDSWIREARVSQGLENRVEGEILTDGTGGGHMTIN